MAGSQVADVIFCLDASGSMGPCFDALRKHIQSFVKGLESGVQSRWDLRLGLLAYQAGDSAGGGIFGFQGLVDSGMQLVTSLYQPKGAQSGVRYFTSDIGQFVSALENVLVRGDEATFIALDTALDFPWRDGAHCHRVVIVMTDEALETGIQVAAQTAKIDDLIEKLHALRVKLFLVGPESEAYQSLCEADRSEFQVLQDAHDGLENADFKQILAEIGKSVSVSALQEPATPVKARRALFGQDKWTGVNADITGH
jgi:hypothetical protein